MRTLKLTLQYDGTDFVGWQRQARGTSIQGLLEDAFAHIEGRAVTVIGAGRTDAGVHALGQVASLALEHRIDVESVQRALNAMLPDAVRVTGVEEEAATFHARYDARSKTYRYRILNDPIGAPFHRRYAWHLARPLDYDAMVDAARALPGQHDFSAFQVAGSSVASTIRTISRAALSRVAWCLPGGPWPPAAETPSRDGAFITFEIEGDGFLRHMVRRVVGTLVDVGAGRRAPETLAAILQSGARAAVGPTAPAHGLFLVEVRYDADSP